MMILTWNTCITRSQGLFLFSVAQKYKHNVDLQRKTIFAQHSGTNIVLLQPEFSTVFHFLSYTINRFQFVCDVVS